MLESALNKEIDDVVGEFQGRKEQSCGTAERLSDGKGWIVGEGLDRGTWDL
jgi:hypothetical protein